MSYTISETFWYPSSRRHGCYTEPHVQARPYINTCHLSNNLLIFSNKYHVLYNSGYSNESLGGEKKWLAQVIWRKIKRSLKNCGKYLPLIFLRMRIYKVYWNFNRSRVQGSEVLGSPQIWTVDSWALKGDRVRIERFEDIEAWQLALAQTWCAVWYSSISFVPLKVLLAVCYTCRTRAGPGVNSQGLWSDKEGQVCSRLRLEGTNSGRSRFTPLNAEPI